VTNFDDWFKRHDDWDNRMNGSEPQLRPDSKDISLRTPNYGRSHEVASVAALDTGSFSVCGTNSGGGLNGNSFAVGGVPLNGGNTFNSIWRCWYSFGTAEGAGVDGSNFTQIVFKVGDDFSSGDTVATATTVASRAAGKTSFVLVSFGGLSLYRPKPNQTLYVTVTRTGTGSTNFNNASFSFGFDFLQERIA